MSQTNCETGKIRNIRRVKVPTLALAYTQIGILQVENMDLKVANRRQAISRLSNIPRLPDDQWSLSGLHADDPRFTLLSESFMESIRPHRKELDSGEMCEPALLVIDKIDLVQNPSLTDSYWVRLDRDNYFGNSCARCYIVLFQLLISGVFISDIHVICQIEKAERTTRQ